MGNQDRSVEVHTYLDPGTGLVRLSLGDGLAPGPIGWDNPLFLPKGSPWYDVKAYGAVGDDTADDGAAILAAFNAIPAAGGTLFFPHGTYKYALALPNFAVSGIRLLGAGNAKLHFTGTGNAVVFDGGVSTGTVFDVRMENLTITGNVNCTNGLFLRSIHHSHFKNIRVTNVNASGLLTNFSVSNTYDTFRVSNNEGAFSPTPVNGILLDARGAGEQTTASVFINPIIEGVSGSGIKLVAASSNTFIGGTSESNGRGIELAALAVRNVFQDIDLESNTIKDLLCLGSDNLFQSIMCVSTGAQGLLHLSGASALNNTVMRCTVNSITVDGGAANNSIVFNKYNYFNTGAFTDSGTSLKMMNHNLGTVVTDDTVFPQVIRASNGTAALPAYAFNSESSGLYRSAINDFRFAIASTDVLRMTAATVQIGTGIVLIFAGTPATNGLIRMPAQGSWFTRNVANGADIAVFQQDAADNLIFGGAGGAAGAAMVLRIPNATGKFQWQNSAAGDIATMSTAGLFSTAGPIRPGSDSGVVQTASGIYAGTGVPANANGANGDFYLRSDGGAGTSIYQRRAGVWVATGA